jgi:hypothetical protein
LSGFPIDHAVWEYGLTLQAYIDQMETHREAMQRRYREVHLSDAETRQFASIDQQIYLAVLTEEWCNDCLMNLPILARIAEATPHMEMKVYVRRQWLRLREYFTSQDIHSIPVAAFLDEDFHLIGTWIERPYAAHEWLESWKAAHPEVEITRKRADLSSDEKKALLKDVTAQMLVDMEVAYRQNLQSETVCEVAALLGLVVPG